LALGGPPERRFTKPYPVPPFCFLVASKVQRVRSSDKSREGHNAVHLSDIYSGQIQVGSAPDTEQNMFISDALFAQRRATKMQVSRHFVDTFSDAFALTFCHEVWNKNRTGEGSFAVHFCERYEQLLVQNLKHILVTFRSLPTHAKERTVRFTGRIN
jgi:hypothetical protein